MTDEPYSVPEPEWLLREETAELGLAEVLAEYLNVTLEMDVEDDEDYPVDTQRVLELARDLLAKLDMLGIELTWKDGGARLLAELGT